MIGFFLVRLLAAERSRKGGKTRSLASVAVGVARKRANYEGYGLSDMDCANSMRGRFVIIKNGIDVTFVKLCM